MAAETTILKAYALASQCKYAEAERVIKSDQETLNTPYGVDLYARILYASGQIRPARHIWEELLRSVPDYEPAQKALAADDKALQFSQDELIGMSRMRKLYIACVVAIALGIAFSIGKACRAPIIIPMSNPPSVVAETSITGRVDGNVLASLREGFLTNLTEETVLVIGGGMGRYVTDRQKRLAVVAECIKDVAKVPLSKMYFQPASESVNEIVLQVVPAWATGKMQE